MPPTDSQLIQEAPVNAWLMIGDEASYPRPRKRSALWRRRTAPPVWTAPPQARPGDLLLFYFLAPRKEIRFAARASSHPFFDSSIKVNALREIDPHQWWITHTPLVEVPPVGFKALEAAFGGHLVLRGSPRHYLRPEVIRELKAAMARTSADGKLSDELEELLTPPAGDPELPEPTTMNLQQWCAMADGPLTLEHMVERYVVEPLLRLALPASASFERQRRMPDGGIPDYVVNLDGVDTSVIEVKRSVAEPRTGDWRLSPELSQLTRYAAALGVPGMLIDSKRTFLVDAGATAPRAVVDRLTAGPDELGEIRRHLLGKKGQSAPPADSVRT